MHNIDWTLTNDNASTRMPNAYVPAPIRRLQQTATVRRRGCHQRAFSSSHNHQGD